MHDIDLGTWLSAISLGEPADIPPSYLALMIQRGYCDQRFCVNLLNVPPELLHNCHSNLDRPPDTFRRIMNELAQVSETEE